MYYYVLQFLSAFLQPLHVWLIKGFGITPRHACLSDKNTAWLTAFRLYSLHLSVPCQSSPPGQWMACQQTLREWHSKGEQIKSDPLQTLRQMPFLSQPTQLTWVSGWHQSILVIYCNGLASSSTLNTTDMWCVKKDVVLPSRPSVPTGWCSASPLTSNSIPQPRSSTADQSMPSTSACISATYNATMGL